MAAVDIRKEQFEEMMAAGKTVLVDYWAPWCGYCRRLKPAMDRLERELEGKLLMGSVDIDREEALSDREKIEVVPTLVIYREGKALGSIVAPGSAGQVMEFIRETLGGI